MAVPVLPRESNSPAQTGTTAAERFLAPYRRITSSGQFIPEIDGLRFIAIAVVILYHLTGDIIRHSPPHYMDTLKGNVLFGITQQLHFGVPLFFVISGFILGLPFASRVQQHKSLSLKRYLWRRVTRLEPPYVISMLVFFVLKLVGSRGSVLDLLPHLGASLLYIHNLVYGTPSAINIVAWSLEIEIQFYLLAPFLAMVFLLRQPLRRIVLVSACAALSLLSALLVNDLRVQLSLVGNAQYFVAGFLLIDLYVDPSPVKLPAWAWDLGSLIGWTLLFGGLAFAPRLVFGASPIVVPYLYYAVFHGNLVNRIFTNVWITTMGGMCYSIYLLHNYVIALTGFRTEAIGAALPFDLRLLIQALLMAPGLIVVCALYFRFIERPCMRADWPRRLRSRLYAH